MQNSPALEQAELSGVQPLLNLLITPVAFTSLTRVRDEKAYRAGFTSQYLASLTVSDSGLNTAVTMS